MAFTTALRADPGANGLACGCAQARRFRERMRVRSTGKARVYEEMPTSHTILFRSGSVSFRRFVAQSFELGGLRLRYDRERVYCLGWSEAYASATMGFTLHRLGWAEAL